MSEPTVQLDYAPPALRRRSKWPRRVLVALVVVAAGWFVVDRYAVPLWLRADLLYRQREVEQFTLPPDTVSHREDGPPYTRVIAGETADCYQIAMPLYELPGANQSVIDLSPKCIDRLLSRRSEVYPMTPGGSGPSNNGTFFLHRRRATAAAPWRIVQVIGYPLLRAHRPPASPTISPAHSLLHARAFAPATWSQDLADVGAGNCPPDDFLNIPAGQLRLYFGQPDPRDDAHFTINYDCPAGRGTIDGWLQPDDSVRFFVRLPPATAPAASPPNAAPAR